MEVKNQTTKNAKVTKNSLFFVFVVTFVVYFFTYFVTPRSVASAV